MILCIPLPLKMHGFKIDYNRKGFIFLSPRIHFCLETNIQDVTRRLLLHGNTEPLVNEPNGGELRFSSVI